LPIKHYSRHLVCPMRMVLVIWCWWCHSYSHICVSNVLVVLVWCISGLQFLNLLLFYFQILVMGSSSFTSCTVSNFSRHSIVPDFIFRNIQKQIWKYFAGDNHLTPVMKIIFRKCLMRCGEKFDRCKNNSRESNIHHTKIASGGLLSH